MQIEVSREFEVEPAVIWAAWTRPELLALWWSPGGTQLVEASVDLRAGGELALTNEGHGLRYQVRAVAETVDEPYLLVLRWRWFGGDREPADSVLRLTVADTWTGCRLALSHGQLADESAAAEWEWLWTDALGSLARSLPAGQEVAG